jgi:hypothetical protein
VVCGAAKVGHSADGAGGFLRSRERAEQVAAAIVRFDLCAVLLHVADALACNVKAMRMLVA